ncbi:unnamed protein product [Camellia sinensis]
MGKVHGSLARAGKVRGQTPKVAKQDKKKKPRGRAHKRMQYNRRFVTAALLALERRGDPTLLRSKLIVMRIKLKTCVLNEQGWFNKQSFNGRTSGVRSTDDAEDIALPMGLVAELIVEVGAGRWRPRNLQSIIRPSDWRIGENQFAFVRQSDRYGWSGLAV